MGRGDMAEAKLTPGGCVGIINSRVHVAKVDLAHEAVDLKHAKRRVRVAGKDTAGKRLG